ncbi:GON-4-like protein isoform X1 [Electrophorus electricus]|uniref:GON-4-like protein isoform X1 n=1 Tax=Electrophorus electricus TaxID=8005 RepID=UPI0015D07D88|nr:GON-4-like protein isoform X1 [Electrophorus electricus]
MNHVRRRKQGNGKTAQSRSKWGKNEEDEGQPRGSAPCPVYGLVSVSPENGSDPFKGEVNAENTTSSRRSGKSKGCSQALYASSENEGVVQNTIFGLSSEDETEKTLVITVDGEQSCNKQIGRRKGGVKRKREMSGDLTEVGLQQQQQQEEEDEDIQAEVEIDRELDRELENKSRQHKLTSANVRSILHEVITNEHVVAMMKAAINDTQPVPLFEPKMTRSKLKEVVEKGVVIPTWNISPIKKPSTTKGPQFVDIPLEEEDSSDEEYCPDEEEDDETAEDTLLESDLESTASSPRGMRLSLNKSFTEHARENSCSPRQTLRRARHLQVEVMPMGPPPPPQGPEPAGPSKECSFMEKLHAVDEELAIGSDCMHSYQSLGNDGEESLMAFRTRSKRPLRDVPLGRLEAELRAPDITPDMYEHGSTLEDREWTQWLQGLMSSEMENEEEADDEDDPEYNFLADIDEPDVEDYRNDKAVRITKKEVNDLMEELFDAFQDELGGQDEEGHEEEEDKEEEYVPQQQPPSVLETIQYEDPLADILNQRYSTVREQLAALRKRKALLESKGVPLPPPRPKRPSSPTSPLFLSPAQKLRLQQHVQQHVQLLTQVSMLSRRVEGLQTEACTTRQFLSELQLFAHRGEEAWRGIEPGFVSIFRACNLEPALMLLQDLDHAPDPQTPGPLFPGSQIAADLAWLLGTRPVFLYPELLPHVDLRPFHYKGPFTSAENCLVVLGHQHLKGTVHPLKLACQYLLAARNFICLRTHVRSACQKQSPNILKKYFIEGKCPPMPLACLSVSPSDQRPPVARHKRLMPWWLRQNLKLIHEEVRKYNQPFADFQPASPEGSGVSTEVTPASVSAAPDPTVTPPYIFPPSTRYPPRLPEALDLKPQPLPPPAGSCRRKAPLELHMQPSTQPSKPLPPAKGLEEALRRLTPILPKPGCPSAQNPIPIPQPEPLTLHLNAHSNRQQISSASSGTAAVSAANPQVALPDITNAADLNRAKLIVTLPAASLGPGQNLPSLGAVAVNPAEDTHIIVPNAAKVAPASPGQGNIVITLPAAPVATAFICPSPAAKQVAQRASAFASLAKDHMSECCGTLLKVSMGPRLPLGLPSPETLSHNTLHSLLLLTPGCIVTESGSCQSTCLNPVPVIDHSQKHLSQQTVRMEGFIQSCLGNIYKSKAVPVDRTSNRPPIGYKEGHFKANDNFQEITEVQELDMDEVIVTEDEQEYVGEEDFRRPFLTLSESSGSPVSAVAGEDDTMQPAINVREEDEGERSQRACVMSVPELQDTKKRSRVTSEPEADKKCLLGEGKSEAHMSAGGRAERLHSALLCDDLSDDDPRRDVKDVAFAQAYLEKVCEAVQVVPGKVEEFLGVLYEFEQDPEGRTSVDLYVRLRSVLGEWPELLRDFAAFLHPEQAQECGLLAEQQAFERSRRFLRQLELSFGEHSPHYRRVVRTLQQGPCKSRAGSEEMKAQIAMLLREHVHLLEEYWVFFERLHPAKHRRSEEEEMECDNVDGVCSVQTVHRVEGSQLLQHMGAISPEMRAETPQHQTHSKSVDSAKLAGESRSTNPETEDETKKEAGRAFCARNSSRMPSGEKVVLWTREADRVILTTCQQRGANQSTFRSIAAQLGHKTATEVGSRYQDLIRLFHESSRQHHAGGSDTEVQPSPREEEPS